MPAKEEGGRWDVLVAPWHLDERLPAFPAPACIAETVSPALPAAGQLDRMRLLYHAIADATARASNPLLLTGDCTAALGAIAGLQPRHGRHLAVVWLDGHGDFNTPATTITGYLGGMPLAMLTGRAPELICHALGLRPVAENNVVLVDARDLDPAEQTALATSGVQHVPAEPGTVSAAVRRLGHMPVYLHIDVDVIHSAHLPGLRVPAGPGPGLADIENCLAAIVAAGNIVAACIACTWLPGHINDHPAAQAITRLAQALGAQLAR